MGKIILKAIIGVISFYFILPTFTRIAVKKDKEKRGCDKNIEWDDILPYAMPGLLFFGIICAITIPTFKTFFNYFTIPWLITNFLSGLYEWHKYEKNKLINKINNNPDANIEFDGNGEIIAISSSVPAGILAPAFDPNESMLLYQERRGTSPSDQLDSVMQDLKKELNKGVDPIEKNKDDILPVKQLNRSDLIDLD